MKTLVTAFALLTSLSAFSCPEVAGKYLCPEEAADEFSLGSRDLQIKKSPYADLYSMKIGDDSQVFELGAWNPGIDASSGEIDFKVENMLECKEDKALFQSKYTEADEEVSITIQGTLEVQPTATGVKVRGLIEGDEFFTYDCVKL